MDNIQQEEINNEDIYKLFNKTLCKIRMQLLGEIAKDYADTYKDMTLDNLVNKYITEGNIIVAKKKNRKKNNICTDDRCIARVAANHKRCKRGKKFGDYCTLHSKGNPYGNYDEEIIEDEPKEESKSNDVIIDAKIITIKDDEGDTQKYLYQNDTNMLFTNYNNDPEFIGFYKNGKIHRCNNL